MEYDGFYLQYEEGSAGSEDWQDVSGFEGLSFTSSSSQIVSSVVDTSLNTQETRFRLVYHSARVANNNVVTKFTITFELDCTTETGSELDLAREIWATTEDFTDGVNEFTGPWGDLIQYQTLWTADDMPIRIYADRLNEWCNENHPATLEYVVEEEYADYSTWDAATLTLTINVSTYFDEDGYTDHENAVFVYLNVILEGGVTVSKRIEVDTFKCGDPIATTTEQPDIVFFMTAGTPATFSLNHIAGYVT